MLRRISEQRLSGWVVLPLTPCIVTQVTSRRTAPRRLCRSQAPPPLLRSHAHFQGGVLHPGFNHRHPRCFNVRCADWDIQAAQVPGACRNRRYQALGLDRMALRWADGWVGVPSVVYLHSGTSLQLPSHTPFHSHTPPITIHNHLPCTLLTRTHRLGPSYARRPS